MAPRTTIQVLRTVLLLVGSGLLAMPATAAEDAPAPAADCTDRRFHWSTGTPAINLRHLFCGEIP